MGSYLEIDERENNSKRLSGILIDAIRDLDLKAQETPYIKEIQKYFVSDEYNEDGIGIGNYRIHRKGMALLVQYLDQLRDNSILLTEMAKEYYRCPLSHCSEEEYNRMLNEFIEDTVSDVLRCETYTLNILVDMIMNRKKHVDAIWV